MIHALVRSIVVLWQSPLTKRILARDFARGLHVRRRYTLAGWHVDHAQMTASMPSSLWLSQAPPKAFSAFARGLEESIVLQ